ncbi:putative quinol monooxygenase [Bradyrhizobium monzae]|uniref:putative quinol monooxygenase n=1 Tax=Bradyrhizobium sp. Oc8 TaxID=2876780 RepID=UPI001F39974D|nr:putative quinol monooxygenase [Bradyrhizobium sp. Oc8]
MDARHFLVLGASLLAMALAGPAGAQEKVQEKVQEEVREMPQPYVRVAEIEIDPSQVEPYGAAVKEQIEAAVRLEPGVLALYAVADAQNPAHVFVFEIYADVDAYKAHIETPHFKAYKAITQDMVKSLKLRDTVPILLGAKRT